LRIGNYIDYTTEREIVTMQTTYEYIRLIHNGNKNFKPIPLTEEWFVKFGFNKNITSDIYPTFSKQMVNWNDGILYIIGYGFMNHIQYVHQLQNLYFALTNEELTLIK
jgi:hypothetical protein